MARRAQTAFFVLGALALVLRVGCEAGLWHALLTAVLLLAAVAATLAAFASRAEAVWIDGWRLLPILIALWSLPSVYPRVGGDGFEYYAIARSLVFDQDLDFDNEFQSLGAQPVVNAQGQITSRFPVGTALVWLLPLVTVRVAAAACAAAGLSVDQSGFSTLYQCTATCTSFALALAGLVLLERLLRSLYGPALALLSILALWLATPLYFYSVANPSMSHAASSFAATAFLVAWWNARRSGALRPWLLAGLFGGLMSLIRIQDAVLIAMPLVDALRRPAERLRVAGALLLGPVVAAAFQLAIWWSMFGRGFLKAAAEQGHYGRPLPHVLGVLFAARHGLFTWTPLYVLAVLGWLLWLKRDASLAPLYLLGFALAVYFNSLMTDWWGADAFGQRRLLGLTPIFGLGLAESLRFLSQRPLLTLGAGLCGLIVWNQQFAYIYNSELLAGKNQAVSLDRLASAQVDVAARRVLRSADSLPRPLFVLLYDNLKGAWLDEGPRSFGGRVDLGTDPPDFPLIGHGWSPIQTEDGVRFRYTSVARSWIRVPLMTPGDFDVSVRIRGQLKGVPVSVRLEAGGERLGEQPLPASWSEISFALPSRLLQPGINEIALSFSTTPMEVIPGFEGRNATAAVAWLRFVRRKQDH